MKDGIKSNIDKEIPRIQNLFASLDKKVIGEEFMPDKIELSKDDREAWVTYIVEMYEQKKPIPEPPSEMHISKEEVVNRIVKRALERALKLKV
jgi:hypothetical protein